MQTDGQVAAPAADVTSLVLQRAQIESRLEDLREEVTVVFSDIVGYTRYVHEHGDVAGITLQQRHKSIFLAQVELHGGHLVKEIGDALMLRFARASSALDASCAVLRRLRDVNRDLAPQEQLHVRIGVATGRALIEPHDVNGEIVNLSSRLCKQAEVDGILVCDQTVERLDWYWAGRCVPQSEVAVRGMEENRVRAFRVVWQTDAPARRKVPEVPYVLLEFVREAGRLKCSHQLAGSDQETVGHYGYVDWKEDLIGDACAQIVRALQRSNRVPGRMSEEMLRKAGGILFDVLLTSEAKNLLSKTTCEFLFVSMEDTLVSVPWELLYDGSRFLSQRFAMGRRVVSRMPHRRSDRHWSLCPRIAVIADPLGNLPSAAREGEDLAQQLGASDRVRVAMRNAANVSYVRKAFREADMIHYCGHAHYVDAAPSQSGWLLSGGSLSGEDVMKMAENEQALPLLVFANACESGRTEEWSLHEEERVYGLASAFLHAGVQHYIGTFADVSDSASRDFASRFYSWLLRGHPIGTALRQARSETMETAAESGSLIWASYMLYGDPTTSVFGVPELAAEQQPPPEPKPQPPEPPPLPYPARRISLAKVAAWVGGALLVFLALWWGMKSRPVLPPGPPPPLLVPGGLSAQVAALSARFRDPKYQQQLARMDAWTSRPLTVAVLPVVGGAVYAPSSDDLEEARSQWDQALSRLPGVHVVERAKIDKALEELGIGVSELADPGQRARIKWQFARFLLISTVYLRNGSFEIDFRLAETETTLLRYNNWIKGFSTLKTAVESAERDIGAMFARDFPVQGRISAVLGDGGKAAGVIVNIGSDVGLAVGGILSVLTEPAPNFRVKVGTLRVVDAQAAAAGTEVVLASRTLSPEMKISLDGVAAR